MYPLEFDGLFTFTERPGKHFVNDDDDDQMGELTRCLLEVLVYSVYTIPLKIRIRIKQFPNL